MPEGKKFWRREDMGNYKMESFTGKLDVGDTLGLLLEFNDEKQGQLTFFRNGGSVGTAFTEIKAGEYFPCLSILHGSNEVTLNSRARKPDQPFRTYEEIKKECKQANSEGSASEGME